MTASEIVNSAIRLGFDKCGIVPVDEMARWVLDKLRK